jgi:outer membrane lipoprotein-sorting protein
MGIKSGHIAAALIAVTVGTFAGAARADDASDVVAKTTATSAGIKSVQLSMNMTIDGGGPQKIPMSMVMTMVLPDRVKMQMNGMMSMATYSVGDGFYYINAGGMWQKVAFDKAQMAAAAAQMKTASAPPPGQIKLLPDRMEDGASVGVYSVTTTVPAMPGVPSPAAGKPTTLTCSYDKQTFLVKKCGNENYVMTFSHYNDPANVVELPPEAKNATMVTMPVPAAKP